MTPSLEVIRAELNSAVAGAEPGLAAANELCLACVGLFGVDGAAVSMVHDGTSRGTFGSSSETSRRLDEYQFTFGEGPCLDAAAERKAVLAPDLDAPTELRWPAFTGAVLDHGIRGVFAFPVMVTSVCVGALDLFREKAGPLTDDEMVGAGLAARLASLALLDLFVDDERDPEGGADTGSVEDPDDERDGWSRLAEMDRIEVYQATGMLISQLNVDAAEALVRLRAHAIATNQTASQVAWAILDRTLVLERDPKGHAGRSPG